MRGQPATLICTDGDEVLVGTAGPDVIVGLAGDDVIRVARAGTTWSAPAAGHRLLRGQVGPLRGGRVAADLAEAHVRGRQAAILAPTRCGSRAAPRMARPPPPPRQKARLGADDSGSSDPQAASKSRPTRVIARLIGESRATPGDAPGVDVSGSAISTTDHHAAAPSLRF